MESGSRSIVRENDRIDTIAKRVLGDPYRFEKIIEDNPTIDPLDLELGTASEVGDA